MGWTWGRATVRAVAVAVLATSGLMVLPPAMACACGGVVNTPGRSTTVTEETALIRLRAGSETIMMSLAARSDATRAGLLVPTPAPATTRLVDRSVFADLDEQTVPRQRVRHHLFGPPAIFTGGETRLSGGATQAPTGVQVLGRVDLGPLRAVTLTADDAGLLRRWLSRHGFTMSPAFKSLVTPYLRRGWAFMAMTLTAKGRSLSGDLPPVELTFHSDRLVYPMRMSRGAKEVQHVRTYVLADHRMTRTDPSAREGDLVTVYADRIRPSLVTSPALRRLAAGTPWLTEFDQTFDHPGRQVVSDFTFARAAKDTPIVAYRYTDEYLIPGDVAALLVVLLVVLIGGTAVGVKARRRRRATA